MPGSNPIKHLTDPDEIKKWLYDRGRDQLDAGKLDIFVHLNAVSVSGNVFIKDENITKIPINFEKIYGDYTVLECKHLQDLYLSPYVVTGSYSCNFNDSLTTLKGSPRACAEFQCNGNKNLISLQGMPDKITKRIVLYDNPNLKNLNGLPKIMNDKLFVRHCNLKSLEGCPEIIKGGFRFDLNPIETLKYLPKEIDGVIAFDYKPNLPLMKLFLVRKLKSLLFTNVIDHIVEKIINKHLPMGKAGLMLCAAELIKAGYKENARL